MLLGFLIIIGCQLAGEIIVSLTGLSIPGTVVGLLLLFIGLLIKGDVPQGLSKAGNGLLKHIGLLFVPAGAGLSMFLGLLYEEWDVVLIASVSSTIATLLVCGWLFQIFAKKDEEHDA